MSIYDEIIVLDNDIGLTVRNIEVSDAEQIISHLKVIDSETRFCAREPRELNLTIEQEESILEGASARIDRMTMVAIVDNQIIGSCSVGISNSKARFKHRASVGVAIQKKFWSIGIGKTLMLKSIDWCKDNGLEQLELEVVTTNDRAVSMYKSLGFEVYGTTWHAFKYNDGSYADEYFMILDLAK